MPWASQPAQLCPLTSSQSYSRSWSQPLPFLAAASSSSCCSGFAPPAVTKQASFQRTL